jgi:RNA polymerase sigma-70 factor (ECF subfamily)
MLYASLKASGKKEDSPLQTGGQSPFSPQPLDQRLSQISTLWPMICQANQGADPGANAARQKLIERYGCAVYRYLYGVLHDADAVDEVFQEFALELVHGRLRGADPRRGRFRDFMKGTLFHLIADYRKQQRKLAPLPHGGANLLTAEDPNFALDSAEDGRFLESWRDELLARAWAALGDYETGTGKLYYTVLRFRADHAEIRSPQMAEQLTAQLGKPCTAVGIRQTLHRAREKFADFLLDEITRSLENPTSEHLEQELAELGLLEYCRPALERYGAQA